MTPAGFVRMMVFIAFLFVCVILLLRAFIDVLALVDALENRYFEKIHLT